MTWSSTSVSCCVPDATGCLVSCRDVASLDSPIGPAHPAATARGHPASELLVATNPNPGPRCLFFIQSSHTGPAGRRSGPVLWTRRGARRGGSVGPWTPVVRHLPIKAIVTSLVEVHVLNAVDEGGTLGQGRWNFFLRPNQIWRRGPPMPPAAFVDHRRAAAWARRCRPWTRHRS